MNVQGTTVVVVTFVVTPLAHMSAAVTVDTYSTEMIEDVKVLTGICTTLKVDST